MLCKGLLQASRTLYHRSGCQENKASFFVRDSRAYSSMHFSSFLNLFPNTQNSGANQLLHLPSRLRIFPYALFFCVNAQRN